MGSFLFVFIGGYGLAYLPIEFLNDFLNRPQIVNQSYFMVETLERCRRSDPDKNNP